MKKQLSWGIALLLAISVPAGRAVAAPSNDDCNNSIDLVPGDVTVATNAGATDSGATRCIGTDDLDVWFYFRPNSTRAFNVSTCGSTFDTTLSIFEGCGGPVVACADNAGPCGFGNNAELTAVTLTGGTDYFFRVAGANSNTGSISILVEPSFLSPPSNDECSNAIDVTLGVPVTATNLDATDSGVTRCEGTDANDVWFYYNPAANQVVNISLCDSTFDTTLSVFDGCGGPVIACNDEGTDCPSNPSNSSLESLALEGHHDYFIRVAGYLGAEGDIRLLLDSPNSPANVPLASWPAALALLAACGAVSSRRKH